MNWKQYEPELQQIQNFINTYPKVSIAIGITIIIILCLLLRYIHIRKQYSNEAWKIVKKNGRKSIFWYDQYGNKTYKKPQNNPNGPKPPKQNRY